MFLENFWIQIELLLKDYFKLTFTNVEIFEQKSWVISPLIMPATQTNACCKNLYVLGFPFVDNTSKLL